MLERLLIIAAIYAIVNLTTIRFMVDGPSMLPTFDSGQLLIVNRLGYLFGAPQRGDVAIFHYPGNPTEDYIKRVIGLPGEAVEVRSGTVYVNGVALTEPYVVDRCTACADGYWQLGPDEFFMMGDNRARSSDSRAFGPVVRKYILGEVVLRYWPPSTVGWISQIGWPQ